MRAKKLLSYAVMTVMAVIPLGIGLKLLQLLISAHITNNVLILPVWPNVCDAALLIMSGLFWLAITFHKWFRYGVR
ncbi:MAG: hypothetical protein DRP11_02170 [Candidatus Aenigmatarchaeota archaeon]|nr:MAG: hypothetical protein DRP11_02170 [Candidatus Aenigmarchaeota archaeon]